MLLHERNVSRAAKRLGLTQSALSAQLRKLREMFGDDLIVSSGHGMVPTRRAQLLRDRLHSALIDLEDVLRIGNEFDPQQSKRHFAFGMTEYAQSATAKDLLARLSAAVPRCTFSIVRLNAVDIEDALRSGMIDVLVAGELMMTERLRATVAWSDRFVMVQRKGHPRGTGGCSLDEFLSYRHLTTTFLQSQRSRTFVDAQLEAIGRARELAVNVSSYDLAVEVLGRTDLVADFPRAVAMKYRAVLDISDLPVETPPLVLMVAWHERHHHEPSHVWVRRAAMAVLYDLAPES